jgi:hypothetical protein
MKKLRVAYMEALIMTQGEFCRKDVQDVFGLGSVVIAKDIKWYKNTFPNNIIYNDVERRFQPSDTFEPKIMAGPVEDFMAAMGKVGKYFSKRKQVADIT